MTENDKIAKYGPIVCHVTSHNEPDKTYAVRLKDGIHQCSCKGWIFSKEVPKSCKHIKAYLADNSKVQKVAESTDMQIVEKCLRTAGCYDPIKNSCERAVNPSWELKHKLARLTQALMPYLGGEKPVLESAVAEKGIIRTIYLD